MYDFSTNIAPKVVGIKPSGSQILVEMLSSKEILGTTLTIKGDSNIGAPQGYVLAIGPNVDPKVWGFEIGNRVLLQGAYIPVPKINDGRAMGIVEPHAIKAILVEDVN